SKPGKKPVKKSWWNRLFHFGALSWMWRLIPIVLIVALIFWQWSAVTSWVNNTVNKVWGLFGWGLVLIAVVVIIILGILWRRQLSTLARRWKLYQWNKWLGGVAFILAIWGILSLFNLGGSFGLSITGQEDFVVILWILGLVIIGIILVAPKACFQLVANFFSWLGKQFKRRPDARPVLQPAPPQKPALPTVAATPEPPEIEPEKEAVTSVLTPTQTQQELKQVAQEVWKKYGESPALITIDGWRLPPVDILDRSPEVEFSQADNMQRAKLLEEALDSYGVEAKVVQINAGPTVTQFGVEPGWDRKIKEIKERDRDGSVTVRLEEVSKTRVKVERITSLASDLALALAAPSIRIEAPVPGKSVVGIEVPNTISSLVSLRGVIETNAFQRVEAKSKLTLALGKGAGGEAIAADLARMPHLLIAGATGSGKTVCLNSIICCLLLHNTPNESKFIMIDPKRVELTPFNSIPHLAAPVIVDTNKALGTLRWLNQEMDKRYQKLATAGVRNIDGYNRNKQGDERFPYIILIIDELADLMMAGFDEVEHILCRLAQLARATGIHLVVATQRPSVDVVTGLIKANFPTRISFAVTSQVDSRTILDMGGAEKLLGRGDMLYMPTEEAKPKRLQGCYVSDNETERLVYFWGSQRREEVDQLKIEELVLSQAAARGEGFPEDPLLEAAKKLVQEHKHISTSFLQRRLHIGYPRAARLMEQLEEESGKGKEEGL
ncbi:MAG: DNA translocase FtsK, partial [Chloroflexi bacterium]|nr:DNA translocase FtsK [Chloroflexota bacterium]